MHVPVRRGADRANTERFDAADGFVGSLANIAGPGPSRRPAAAGEDILALLARAVQQLHTYPASSTLCVSAIEAARQAIETSACDRLAFRVTPYSVIVNEEPVGEGGAIGRELARRLHRAAVASVIVDREASSRELSRFCEDLVRCGERSASPINLAERLAEHGIEHVTVEMATRPEVLEVGPLMPGTADALERERVRFDERLTSGSAVSHLYPPQKGWIRLDASGAPPRVSLLDLALLAGSPDALALMLLRLTDEAAGVTPAQALERKYSDVALLVSALDPPVARRMLSTLARAVLDLDPRSRQALLRRTVLPGLLDGRIDGAILRDFPDIDLAESLCLLLDLETAAPELLSTALSRLALPPERHAAMAPLLDQQLRARQSAAADQTRQSTLVRHARELVRVEGGAPRCFQDYAAFDLSMDTQTAASLDHIRTALPAVDRVADQLTCLWHLVCLEPNPDDAARFLSRSFTLLDTLERESRTLELPAWLAGYRHLAGSLRDSRPDVADVLENALGAFCTPARAAWIVDLSVRDASGREAAGQVIAALGASIAVPLVALLDPDGASSARHDSRGDGGRSRTVLSLLLDHAPALAPSIAPMLQTSAPGLVRPLLRVLGSAGAGYEDAIAPYLSAPGEPVAREALRALARIGSSRAASLVAAEIFSARGAFGVAAEETLWHFPAQEAHRHTRELLARRDFTTARPQATERLLDRAVRAGATDLTPILPGIAAMRFRIWNPALARVARKANTLLKASAIP